MKKILSLLLILVLSISSFSIASAQDNSKQRYLIEFTGQTDAKAVQNAGGTIRYQFTSIPVIAAELTEDAVLELENNPGVLYVEEDAEVIALGQEIPWGIDDVQATEAHQTGIQGQGIRIGVMDTGIDLEHEDISVAGGISFVSGITGYDDDNGHGTHVAGIIAALNNTIGVIGTAPEASLYSIKVLNANGSGYYSDIIAGIEWGANNNIDILSMSFGGLVGSKALKKALVQAEKTGLLLIAAAGNSGGYGKLDTINYPANYNSVIAVGAIDQNRQRTAFSSIGKDLELMAPGVSILSTIPGGYAAYNGTSMATPFVSGVAALVWQQHPELSNKDIREILNHSAVPLGDSFFYGNGEVNAVNALNYANTINK